MGQMPNICPLCFAALSLRTLSEAVDLNCLLLLLVLALQKYSLRQHFFCSFLESSLHIGYCIQILLLSSLFPFLTLISETRSIRQVLTVDTVTCRSLSFLQPPAFLLPYPEEPDCLTSHHSLCYTHHSSYPVVQSFSTKKNLYC